MKRPCHHLTKVYVGTTINVPPSDYRQTQDIKTGRLLRYAWTMPLKHLVVITITLKAIQLLAVAFVTIGEMCFCTWHGQ